VLVTVILSALALLSFALLLWQFAVAWRFPLHATLPPADFAPGVTLLKPVKGCDEYTADCLRSWLRQEYRGPVQVLFGAGSADDPACDLVRQLLREFPQRDAELVIADEWLGTNGKVSALVHLSRRAKHGLICVSDADVRVPEDFLARAVAPLQDAGIGLVNCFYQLANPATPAMRWEAVAVNADFWSQVLQSNSLRPQDFALGAVMLTRREVLAQAGGFEAFVDHLADDFQLGRRIAATGTRIHLLPVVVECWDPPMSFRAVWRHQLRWARAIRVSRPAAYFFSILANATLWAALLALAGNLGGFPLVPDALLYDRALPPQFLRVLGPVQVPWVLVVFGVVLGVRVVLANLLHGRLTRRPRRLLQDWWLVAWKDFAGVAVWAASFLGNTIEWRGSRYRLTRDGRLVPV
jgi:ceramide glucosyltransferase